MKAEGHGNIRCCGTVCPETKLSGRGACNWDLAEEVLHGGPAMCTFESHRGEAPYLPWQLEKGRSNQASHDTSIKPQTATQPRPITIPCQVLKAYFQFKWLFSKLNWAHFESQISWDTAFQGNTSPCTNVFLLLLSLIQFHQSSSVVQFY